MRARAASSSRPGVDERRPGLVARPEAARHERRVPVPHPPAVVALAQVLLQPGQVGRAGAVRVVRGDGVGDLVERPEPLVELVDHERADALHAARARSGARRRRARARAAIEFGGSHSAMAVSDEMPPSDAPTSTGGRSSARAIARHVAGERVEAVVAVGRPLALAVAAQVDREGPPPGVRELARGRPPRMSGLPAAVQEHHRAGTLVAAHVADEAHTAVAAEGDGGRRGDRHTADGGISDPVRTIPRGRGRASRGGRGPGSRGRSARPGVPG